MVTLRRWMREVVMDRGSGVERLGLRAAHGPGDFGLAAES